MKINHRWFPFSFSIIVILLAFLGLAHSEQDYNPNQYANPSSVEQINTGYYLDLGADYSPVKSIDNNIEPASNLIIVSDPAKAAQYEANVFSQETAKLYQQQTYPASEDSLDYKSSKDEDSLLELNKKDSQTTRQTGN